MSARKRARSRWGHRRNLAGEFAQHLLGATHSHDDRVAAGALMADHQREREDSRDRDRAAADDALAKIE
jgi:hypothetical protein